MIYLASPYSNPDADVRQQRFESACRAAATLILQGKTVFSPIAHGHSICRYGVPVDWGFWQRHDHRHLEACDEVIVLMLDGWRSVAQSVMWLMSIVCRYFSVSLILCAT